MGVWVAGPATAAILADWGADVIKIEPADRRSGPDVRADAGMRSRVNPPFEMDNRSKRSIVLDLTTAAGRRTAFELLTDADVFVTNVRPGALQRLGSTSSPVSRPQPPCGLRADHRIRRKRAGRRPRRLRRAAFWARAGVPICSPRRAHPRSSAAAWVDHSAGMTLAAGCLRRTARP
ncbi:coA-transferase III family protein [Mycobacterium kansasii 662]|uniref:CoA-transferase III family protein n=1 Tax=Mycobacterium kansasii 662 TaxID=1299326 RepID=X7YPM4_MYCKA|nr:coA-transferase III family protein [Mycobacterium kansasii 662]